MTIGTTAASPWPSKIAIFAAGVFAVASVGTNAVYGWSRGDSPASSLIWAAVAIAVSLAFTLTWPATQRAFSNKDWPAAVMCTVAMVLFGSFSMAGALGAASSGRTTAAAVETDTAGARKRAQSAYDQAQAELARLEASRSVAEMIPLVEAAKPQCRVRVDSTGRQTVCSKPSGLLAELGRAHRRVELQDQIEKANATLAIGSGRPANSDSKAVAKYLAAIGIDVTPDRVTDLLVLLAVLVLEIGPGACLTLGLTLSASAGQGWQAPAGAADHGGQPEKPLAATLASQDSHSGQTPATAADHQQPLRPTAPATLAQLVEPDIVRCLRAAGGKVESLRKLAEYLDRPRSSITAELHKLAAAGVVALARGRHGTVVSLAGVARPN